MNPAKPSRIAIILAAVIAIAGIALILYLILGGFAFTPAAPAATAPAADYSTEPLTEADLEQVPDPFMDVPAGYDDKPAPDAAPAETAALPYTQTIGRADQSIYQGPGYDYCFVDTVREKGVYTIVEEAVDPEGNLWGKLKSGMGWVDLTQIRSESYANALISANYADNYMLTHGEYHHFSQTQEYTIPIAFRAYGKLRDVTLLAMDFDAKGYVPGAELFTLQEMTAEKPLVAELAFPGDMTTYGIRFLDESGISHDCIIYISGRNGALVLQED